MTELRARKRRATRESISDTATRLFWERGFDKVTVDEIAAAADVGRMTVFNHFPRKEDLFFDRDAQARDILLGALRDRAPGVAAIDSQRLLARRLVAEQSPYLSFNAVGQRFVETIEGSEALKARARAIRDELAAQVALTLSEGAGRAPGDSDAYLAAHLLLTVWSVAFVRAHHVYRESQDAGMARATFLALIEQGSLGMSAALASTPYA